MRTLAVLIACLSLAAAGEFDGTVRLGGSSTLLPIMADCANQFMEKHGTWNKVDPSFPAKSILIYVTGGGSGFGVKAAVDGTVDIGMSSRPLKDEEKAKLGEHQAVLISKDCVAFAANRQSAIAKARDSLTRDEAARILSGQAVTWKDLDAALPAEPIVLMVRDAAGGSSEIVQKSVLKDRTFSSRAIQVPSQGANLKRLEGSANAFGYLSSVLALGSDQLKVFAYEGVAPSNEKALSGEYALTRPLLLVIKGAPSPYAQAFIDFILGDGQAIVENHGYVRVKAAAGAAAR